MANTAFTFETLLRHYAKWVPKHDYMKDVIKGKSLTQLFRFIQGPRCYCLVSRVGTDTDMGQQIVVMTDEGLHLSIITHLSG